MSVIETPPRLHLNGKRTAFIAGITLLFFVLAVAFLSPRYQTQIATVDGVNRWSTDTAPPRREIVWQTAVPLAVETDHGIRPQIADHGNTLYFTIGTSSEPEGSELEGTGDLDIVRSRRLGDGWSTPERVDELNSAADDVGPVISADGNLLYLYSNRAGGFGGMDLYESKFDGNVWSTPVNLGAKINTPAHEYDPAITPNAERLYFSSNRSESLHRQWIEGTYDKQSNRWSNTLRYDQGNRTFDLYQAGKIADVNGWSNVAPLTLLNTGDHNEGTPFVSTDGAFLLFASDRPTGRGEPNNYDIYRARIDQFELAPENLGSGINTSANEIEPCLAGADFELFFSRSDLQKPSRYALYQSTAKEIYQDARWDHSRRNALVAWLGNGIRALWDNLWWLLLILAVSGLMAWFVRTARSHHLAIPGFLIAALLLHFFLVTGSFFVYFQQSIVQKISKLIEEELVVATQELFRSTALFASAQPSFNGVAELELPKPVSPVELPRQTFAPPITSQPIELDQPLQLAGNTLIKPDAVSADGLVATMMVDDEPIQPVQTLPRVPVTHDPIPDQLPLAQIVAFNVPQVENPHTKSMDIERQQAPPSAVTIQAVAVVSVDSQSPPVTPGPAKPHTTDSLVPLTVSDQLNSLPLAPLKRSPVFTSIPLPDSAIATSPIKPAEETARPATSFALPKIDIPRQVVTPLTIDVVAPTLTAEVQQPAVYPQKLGLPVPMSRLAETRSDLETQPPLVTSALTTRSVPPNRDYADASINLQNLLLRRKLDEPTKTAIVKEFGGNDETLSTIRQGLVWIEQHQAIDGHWGLNDFHERCQGHKQCDGRGSSDSDTAGTALALLPLLGDGNTHLQGQYKDVVARGITWLIKNQKPDGNLFTGGQGIAFMYSHAIATIALCECYNMSRDVSLRGPAQRGIDFIVAAQDPRAGGWRYQPREQSDTSVVGWQIMALKSGQMADLNVPEKTLKESQRWLDSVAGVKEKLGQFAYQNGRFTAAMTAEAILCLEYLGQDRGSESIVQGTRFLVENLPKAGRDNSYYWYYGTQAMFHLQGEPWQRWNEALHPLLLETQKKDGTTAGTWDPRDQWEQSGGRIYATSLRLLMLEIYYRHLPIYQVID